MTTLNLTTEQLDQVRRTALQEFARDLEATAELVGALADLTSPSPTDTADAWNSVGLVLQSLAVLDALGWPGPYTEADDAR